MIVLKTENLTKTYGLGDNKVTALNNANLRACSASFRTCLFGEFYCFLR